MTASITCPIKKYIFRLSKNKEQNIGKRTKSESVFCSISILFPTEKNIQNNFLCRRSLVSENVDWNNNYEKGKDQFTFLVFTNNLIFYAIIGNYIEI
jgi:hypothetical protein